MKRPVVMILLAGALTLSMIAPSALPAVAGNVKRRTRGSKDIQ